MPKKDDKAVKFENLWQDNGNIKKRSTMWGFMIAKEMKEKRKNYILPMRCILTCPMCCCLWIHKSFV